MSRRLLPWIVVCAAAGCADEPVPHAEPVVLDPPASAVTALAIAGPTRVDAAAPIPPQARPFGADAANHPVANGLNPTLAFFDTWLPPVQGHLTSPFGPRGEELHDAVDIGAKMGSEVVAPAPLRIETIAYQKRAGRFVTAFVLDEDGKKTGWRLTFAHLSHVAVFEGDRVRRGARLGLIGHSGTATGPHLHLRLEMPTDEGGRLPIDPLALLTLEELTGAQDSAGQDSAGQDSAGQDSAGQDSAVKDRSDEQRSDEDSAVGNE